MSSLKNYILFFKNHERKMESPFVAYADVKCFTKTIAGCKPNPKTSVTNEYQHHKPSGFCICIKCFDDFDEDIDFKMEPIVFLKEKESDDVAFRFVEELHKITKSIHRRYYKFPKNIFLLYYYFFLSAFYHPHFVFRVLLSAIHRHPVFTLQTPVCSFNSRDRISGTMSVSG